MPSAEKIIPIEHMVLAGFLQRYQQVFNCRAIIYNGFDKIPQLQKVYGQGAQLQYPYAFIEIQSLSANKDTYNTQQMVRKGLVTVVDSGSSVKRVRIMPASFELNITFITNSFDQIDQGSVMSYSRRWLTAYRGGYLKSTINYGLLSLNTYLTMPESVTIPSRDNVVETETAYQVVGNLTLHGYVSEPILAKGGLVNTLNINSTIQGVNPKTISQQTFLFNTSSSS